MAEQQHPITIPPDLEEELLGLWPQDALQRAAQWGSDQELQACCEWLDEVGPSAIPLFGNDLRTDRRPRMGSPCWQTSRCPLPQATETRQALEELPMTNQHPITPSIELVSQWTEGWNPNDESLIEHVAKQAARWGADWGADIELDACCEWIANNSLHHAESDLLNDLRAARRPKPSSLAEEALKEVGAFEGMGTCDLGIIRRALERLQELEGQGDD